MRDGIHAMEAYTGVRPGYRRAHARGIGLRGRFTATPAAAELTTAEHLQGPPVHVVVRLSNGAGNPTAPDLVSPRHGTVYGLGIAFQLPSGGHATWAAASLDTFPARTPEEFVAVTTAQRPGPGGRPNLLRLAGFGVSHPHDLAGLRAIASAPAVPSFANVTFNGLHAYFLVDGEGRRQPFRYSWRPVANAATLTQSEAAATEPQYLTDEIAARLAQGPVSWTLMFTLAEDDDRLDDVTVRWPEDRRTIAAGTLVVDRVHEDQDAVENMVFDPTGVPPGIECGDDPLLRYRAQTYGESYRRRHAERNEWET
ncbi:MAG TPA: catalase family peroxidase [Pseudonocardiaceae bacterium]